MATAHAPRAATAEQSLDLRVEDFLEDKLQSTTDLEALPSLLASVELQRSQLQSQLDKATRELETARLTSQDRQRMLLDQTSAFQDLQRDIDARVRAALESDAPTEAIALMQGPMRRLQAVELAQSYLEMLRDVETWRQEAHANLQASKSSPKAALESYAKLRTLATRLGELQGATDGAAVHLVGYVQRVADMLWDEMKKTLAAEMEAILKERGWPANIDPADEMDEEWMACFEKMLDLQVAEIRLASRGAVITLLPFDVMSRIFSTEFRFHFLSDRPTSNPQALGTHCFPWWQSTVEKWEGFFRDNIGHLLAAKFHDTSAASRLVYIDPACALVASMLPVVREKVASVLVHARKDPTFLSDFIGQLLSFDETLRSRYSFDEVEDGNIGLVGDVLRECFDEWFSAEKEFALERYKTIMAAPEAGTIDYDYSVSGRTKPSFAAVRIMDLLKTVTDKYRLVPTRRFKTKFLIYIQIAILEQYFERLGIALDAYFTMTSRVGRTLQGTTKEQLAKLEGVGRLELLCSVYGSADHIYNTLREWVNEEFFIVLWDELDREHRSKHGQEGTDHDNEVRSKTSANLGSGDGLGTFFDEMIDMFDRRRQESQGHIINALTDAHTKALKPYESRTQWTTTINDAVQVDTSVTAELDEPLQVIKRDLEFLSRTVNPALLRRLVRGTLQKVHTELQFRVLMSNRFTTSGAAQFQRDVAAVCAVFERFAPNSTNAAMAPLRESLVLLNLPLEIPEGADAAAAGPTLIEASDRMFKDNTEAKAVLAELGLLETTPADARNILKRRVENNV